MSQGDDNSKRYIEFTESLAMSRAKSMRKEFKKIGKISDSTERDKMLEPYELKFQEDLGAMCDVLKEEIAEISRKFSDEELDSTIGTAICEVEAVMGRRRCFLSPDIATLCVNVQKHEYWLNVPVHDTAVAPHAVHERDAIMRMLGTLADRLNGDKHIASLRNVELMIFNTTHYLMYVGHKAE